jgi:hypothetical protein
VIEATSTDSLKPWLWGRNTLCRISHFVENQSAEIHSGNKIDTDTKNKIMKKVMKNLIAAAIVISGVLTVSQSALAQSTFVANDLYMGFENQAGGGTKDYIINFGAASSIVGGSVVVNLSSDFSLSDFDAVLGSSTSMFGGVAGGQQGSTADVYLTQLRSGGAGTPSVPGSTVTATMTRAQDDAAVSALAQAVFPTTVGQGILDATKSWEAYVEPASGGSTFLGNTGLNPDSPVSPSTVLYEDLWFTTKSLISGSAGYTYQGYFTLDLTGSSPKLTFTPTNAPAQLQPPVFQSIRNASGTITLIWSAVPTYTYQLQYTASLSPTNWINLGSSVVAANTTMTNTDSIGANQMRFYRVSAH